MPALAIALAAVVIGVVLLIPLSAQAKGKDDNRNQPPPEGDGETGTGETKQPVNPKALLPGLAGGAGIVGAGLAWAAANAAVGKALTGDNAGAVAGVIGGGGTGFLGSGQAGNVGRVIGMEIDQALGGIRGGATSVVAQAGGFATGMAISIFGTAAGASLFLFTSLAYAFASAITDIQRLQYGQKGALAEYWRQWPTAETKMFDAIKRRYPDGNPFNSKTWGNEAGQTRIERWSWPMADGYMRECNRLNYSRAILGIARGVGVDNVGHGKFMTDRGYFCGGYSGQAGPPNGEPEMRWWRDATYAQIRIGDPAGTKVVYYNTIRGYRYRYVLLRREEWPEDVETRDPTPPPAWIPASALVGPAVEADKLTAPSPNVYMPDSAFQAGAKGPRTVSLLQWYTLTWEPVYRKDSGISDELGEKLADVGAILANIEAWVEWNGKPHGAFVGDYDHAKYGFEHGQFHGDSIENAGGKAILNYNAARWDKTGKAVE